MAITYAPKVGEILECDFGVFQHVNEGGDFDHKNYNGRIPPEMIKKRMIMVLNGKLNNGCLIVPISSTKNLNGINRGYHVPLSDELFKVTDFYDARERWVKCELVQFVSRSRLFKLRDKGMRFDQFLPREVVTLVQKGVIKSINASALLED